MGNPVNPEIKNNTQENREQSARHTAHDLNNIFTRIVNSVELIRKKNPEDTETIRLLASIENGAYLASEIMEDLITESSGSIKRKRKINLNNLILDLINSVSIHLSDRIEFTTNLDAEIKFVEGKYTDYYRIIMNLIINASEAINGKGIISISTKNMGKASTENIDIGLFEQNDFVELKISDNGTGIDKSILPNIFDNKFSTKSKTKSRGFGLAIVKNIVDLNNGLIKVMSEKNKGTEFILKFPAVGIGRHSECDDIKSILIAEDEEIQRLLLTELLQSYNYNVTAFSNGDDLIEELKKKNYDLLIIDRKMPGMDGIDCIKNVKKTNRSIPIILATGSQNSSNDNLDADLVDVLINKPYNFEEMLGLIRQLIK